MTREEFKVRFGREPQLDDLERVACTEVGKPGHFQCGICQVHNLPRFTCGCFLACDMDHALSEKHRLEVEGALREVSNVAKQVASKILHEGGIQNHGHRENPGACGECALVNSLVKALEDLNRIDGVE